MKEYAKIIIPDLIFNKVTCKLFKAEIFNSAERVRFSENFRSVDDMKIFPSILKHTRRVTVVNAPLYFYRSHSENVTGRTMKTITSPLERALCFMERYPLAKDLVPDTMPMVLKKATWFGVSTYMWLNKENEVKYANEYKIIRNFFIKYKRDILTESSIDKFRKAAARLIIWNWTRPFKILSKYRQGIKNFINKFYDKN